MEKWSLITKNEENCNTKAHYLKSKNIDLTKDPL